jgi:cyclic-di-GMP-binding protein
MSLRHHMVEIVGREGFEPSKATPAGLQPAPFVRSGTDPSKKIPAVPRPPLRGQHPETVVVIRFVAPGCQGICARPEGYRDVMPTFDVVSEVDMQEVRNAVDQANREAGTRFDFKGTESSIEIGSNELVLRSSTEDRLRALNQVLEEKLVRRKVSLKALEHSKIEEGSKGSARQRIAIHAGISQDHAKKINRHIKDMNLKGVSSQTQGDQLRVTSKKRDDLQSVITELKEGDFGIPLQFTNFRD